MYNMECYEFLQTAARNEYTEKYSRGRRGAPAKGVGRLSRRESSNLSFSAKKSVDICRRIFSFVSARHNIVCSVMPSNFICDFRHNFIVRLRTQMNDVATMSQMKCFAMKLPSANDVVLRTNGKHEKATIRPK